MNHEDNFHIFQTCHLQKRLETQALIDLHNRHVNFNIKMRHQITFAGIERLDKSWIM